MKKFVTESHGVLPVGCCLNSSWRWQRRSGKTMSRMFFRWKALDNQSAYSEQRIYFFLILRQQPVESASRRWGWMRIYWVYVVQSTCFQHQSSYQRSAESSSRVLSLKRHFYSSGPRIIENPAAPSQARTFQFNLVTMATWVFCLSFFFWKCIHFSFLWLQSLIEMALEGCEWFI